MSFKRGVVPSFRAAFLAPRYWPTWLGLLLLYLLSLSPWQLRHGLADLVGRRLAKLDGKRQQIARANLALAFPQKSEQERERMLVGLFSTSASSMLDYGVLWWGSRRRLRRLVSMSGAEHLRRAADNGQYVILLTAHTAMLDYGAIALTMNYPGVGLIKPARNALVNWFMIRGRLRFESVLYERNEGLRPVIRAIKSGCMFYYLPDEDLSHLRGSDWVFAPFFGVPKVTITTLSRLSSLTGAQVLPALTCYIGHGRYEFRVRAPLKDFPSGDVERDAQTQNRVLEEMLSQYPEQYMWTLRIYRTRPDETDSIYLR